MTVQFIDCEQGSETWYEARRGLPTSSRFKDVLAKGEELAMRRKYMRQLAAERYSGAPVATFRSARMEDGHRQEDLIRRQYSFLTNESVRRIGFARNAIAGASTDGLIGNDGVLEIKSADPHILFEILEKKVFPTEHVLQCQGALWVCEREWCAIAIGCFPDPPPPIPYPVFIKRVYRDEKRIGEIVREVRRFDEEIAARVEMATSYVPF